MQRPYVAPVPSRTVPRPAVKTAKPNQLLVWTLIGGAALFFLFSMTMVALGIGALVMYGSGRILPGVSVMGVRLGGLSVDDATAELGNAWSAITVRDGQRLWTLKAATLGLTLDAQATALEAQRHGRGDGSLASALLDDSVTPVVTVNQAVAAKALQGLAQTVAIPATNATVRLTDNGQLAAIPAADGKTLDVQATLNRLTADPAQELADGAVDLVMTATHPTVTDASALLAKGKALLSSPLTIDAFDPIAGKTTVWTLPQTQWGQWLTTRNGASGVSFSLDSGALSAYLTQQVQAFGDGRHLDIAHSVDAIQTSVAAGTPHAMVQVLHQPIQYTVVSGDTIGSIAWAHGVPMWRIAKANGGLDMNSLRVGQAITIPSQDDMLPLPVVENKRIVISISKQHMWVYENGQIKWDWVASTGIPDSPTAPGVFQVQSHEVNAYAGNWNLWMPHFMGIYEAVPGFMNGIHGFPTRNGAGVIWEGALGRPVTYGCILLSSANAELLYNWAEDGVVVQIDR